MCERNDTRDIYSSSQDEKSVLQNAVHLRFNNGEPQRLPTDIIGSTIINIGSVVEETKLQVKYKNIQGEEKCIIFEFDETGIWFDED